MTGNSSLVRLESICHLITDGKHGDCLDEDDSGYFFISAKDINNGEIQYDNARQITQQDFLETHRRTQLEPLDILVTNSGTIGRVAIAKDNENTSKTTFQKSVAILKPDKKQVHPRWLFYYLQHVNHQLDGIARGAAQKNLLLRDLRDFKTNLVSLETQRRIVDTLTPYDDLIENNRRRIDLLEQAARMLYKEWFVSLRFPGHEHFKIKDGVPQGWEREPLSELADSIIYGYTASAATEPVGPKFLRITDIVPDVIDWDTVPYCQISDHELEKYHLKEGDIVVARTGATVGYVRTDSCTA